MTAYHHPKRNSNTSFKKTFQQQREWLEKTYGKKAKKKKPIVKPWHQGLDRQGLTNKEIFAIWEEGFMSDYWTENPYGKKYEKIKDVTVRVRSFVGDIKADAWRAGHSSCWKPLENLLGQVQYENDGGLTGETLKECGLEERAPWEKTDEHRRDDFRYPSQLKIEVLLALGILDVDAMRKRIMEGKLKYPFYKHW